MIDSSIAYNAVKSHDPRFDGVFFVGVTSTTIYCRPICPAKTPIFAHCRFFANAEAAEKAGFRPCLRCRPELAPGNAPVDDAGRIAQLIATRLQEGQIANDAGLETIAAQFELSSRQLRRIVQSQLGVSPIELLQTRRLLLAKQLLTETALPITEIAFASGFGSLRRFNAAFLEQYRMPPTRLRKAAVTNKSAIQLADTSTLQLGYRPPFGWEELLAFLSARTIKSVEHVTGDTYFRTVLLGEHKGWIAVRHMPKKHCLQVEFTHSLSPVLPMLLGRLRNLFDLSARPDLIAGHLGKDPTLKRSVTRFPGLRVPGAFDGFELAVRAILGQQVTVKAATTLACRFAERFGETIETPYAELSRLSPTGERVSTATLSDIASLGIVGARSASIIALAEACHNGTIRLCAGAVPEQVMKQLVDIPGIGAWTAQYIAMRALRWPDAFPKEDIAIRNNLGGVTAKQAEALSQAWRPWRSYAVFHIWKSLSTQGD